MHKTTELMSKDKHDFAKLEKYAQSLRQKQNANKMMGSFVKGFKNLFGKK